LNAFAQASLRHEPFFFACEEHLPELVYSDECEVRQLAMIAHAYVRVGLVHSSLLPLVWDRATRLAPHCDAQGVALMIFATTKAAVTETSGLTLLRALSCRLLELLKGQSLVPQQTIAVSTYALAKSGYKDCVDKAVWSALAYHARCKLRQFSMTEAANLASAFAEVLKDNIEETENTTLELRTFFDDLLVEVRRRMASENLRMRSLPLASSSCCKVYRGLRRRQVLCSSRHCARTCKAIPSSSATGSAARGSSSSWEAARVRRRFDAGAHNGSESDCAKTKSMNCA